MVIGSKIWPVGISVGVAIIFALTGACTSSGPTRKLLPPGTAGMSAQAGTTGAAGTDSGAGGAGAAGVGAAGTGGDTTGAAGTGAAGTGGRGMTGAAGNAADGSTTIDATAGMAGSDAGMTTEDASAPPFDAVGRTPPTCKTPKPSPIPSQKPTNECDYLLQSLDFEDKWSYVAPSIVLTSFGTAFGLYEINNCSPYCYSKALTVGVDIVGGGDPKQLQGEIIVRFPATGPELPILSALNRDSLAWINLDGPTAPPFVIKGQLVFETTAGIVAAKDQIPIGYANWLDYQHAEFKYFGIKAPPTGPFPVTPVMVTGIGFRIMAPADLPKGMEWHGVAYIDHLQIRTGPENSPPGAYPYGL